uniref:sulfatase-like hydrolase/transferase n=1 Tax=Pricia sp. TaxID=2268138 RepID=UPI003592E90A
MTKSRITYLACYLFVFCSAFGQDNPNILWITIEDTSPQFIGCYGNQDAATPVIDKLAEEGVLFTNAFSTGTVCSPSRSAIITGVPTYKLGTGHHRSKVPVPEFIKGFPYFLKKAGYHTSNNFKTDYNVANEKQFVQEAWHESSDSGGWWNKKPGQLFFSVFNFAESHQSRTMSMSFDWYIKNVREHLPEEEIIADTAFEMPPIYRDSPKMRKQMARVYNAIALTDIRIGE